MAASPHGPGAEGPCAVSLLADHPGAKLTLLEPTTVTVTDQRDQRGAPVAVCHPYREVDPNPAVDCRWAFQRGPHDDELSSAEYASSLFAVLDSKGTNMVSGLELERLILEIGVDEETAKTIPMKDMLMKRVCKKADFTQWFVAWEARREGAAAAR